MSKTNLTTTFFRARLFERVTVQFRSVFVWDFGQFSTFSDFYQTVKGATVKRDDCKIEFYVCRVGDSAEVLLDSVNLSVNPQEILNYDHPKRYISRN